MGEVSNSISPIGQNISITFTTSHRGVYSLFSLPHQYSIWFCKWSVSYGSCVEIVWFVTQTAPLTDLRSTLKICGWATQTMKDESCWSKLCRLGSSAWLAFIYSHAWSAENRCTYFLLPSFYLVILVGFSVIPGLIKCDENYSTIRTPIAILTAT